MTYSYVLAWLELHGGDGSFTSGTWVFHYPNRAPYNLQNLSQRQGRNFEFSSMSKGREGISANMTMITYSNDDMLKSLNDLENDLKSYYSN